MSHVPDHDHKLYRTRLLLVVSRLPSRSSVLCRFTAENYASPERLTTLFVLCTTATGAHLLIINIAIFNNYRSLLFIYRDAPKAVRF